MKELTQEFLKSILYYDEFTGIFVWLDSRHNAVKVGSEAGFVTVDKRVGRNGKSYRRIIIRKKEYKLHRLAFLYMTGNMPEKDVGHEDGDGLNNKWSNLRDISNLENSKNQRIPRHNKSGFLGVYWKKPRERWVAEISVNGRKKHLGDFKDIEDAIAARKAANIKYNYHPNHGQLRTL